jgi:hypothetical protein
MDVRVNEWVAAQCRAGPCTHPLPSTR